MLRLNHHAGVIRKERATFCSMVMNFSADSAHMPDIIAIASSAVGTRCCTPSCGLASLYAQLYEYVISLLTSTTLLYQLQRTLHSVVRLDWQPAIRLTNKKGALGWHVAVQTVIMS